jgi:hypothetical protein
MPDLLPHPLQSLVTADVPLTPENVRPGYLAMLVVGILIVATVILMRSFVKHFRRASEPWEGEEDHDPHDAN